MRTLQTKLCRAGTHTHVNKERKLRGDLSVVTLQIVLKKEEKKEKKKKKKETKTCGVFLDSACGCCKNVYYGSLSSTSDNQVDPTIINQKDRLSLGGTNSGGGWDCTQWHAV